MKTKSVRKGCKVFAIHGSMLGVRSILKSKQKLSQQLVDGMCSMFHDEIVSNDPKVHLFKWMGAHNESEVLNPLAGLQTYLEEAQLIKGIDLQNRLYSELGLYQPNVIIAHSMGCQLLLNVINNNGLPDEVRYIVTINSDAPSSATINNPRVVNRISNGSLKWINLYALDPTLASSTLINKEPRAGLIGAKSQLAINQKISIKGNHNHGFQSPAIKAMIEAMTMPDFDLSDWEEKIN
jgi:hypothetical protein